MADKQTTLSMYALSITYVVEAQYIKNKINKRNGINKYKNRIRIGTTYKSIIKGNPAQGDFSGRQFFMHGILS